MFTANGVVCVSLSFPYCFFFILPISSSLSLRNIICVRLPFVEHRMLTGACLAHMGHIHPTIGDTAHGQTQHRKWTQKKTQKRHRKRHRKRHTKDRGERQETWRNARSSMGGNTRTAASNARNLETNSQHAQWKGKNDSKETKNEPRYRVRD